MDAKSPSLEKQKKGNLYVYKFSPISVPGGRTPDHLPSGTKKSIPASMWSLTKSLKSKSKSKPKPSQSEMIDPGNDEEKKSDKNRKVKESEMGMGMRMEIGKEGRRSVSSVEGILMSLANGRKSVSGLEEEIGREGRKSVSSVEGILMSLANGRKSVSGLEEEIKGKEFPLTTQEQGGKKSVAEAGRKSVSHVENNMAYVGKFVDRPRKSTGAKLETNSNNNVESAMALLQVKVLVTDMPGFMQLHASQCARKTYDSLEKFSAKHLAFNLKKEFDKVYGPAWHCIVGSSFGSFVTHSTGCFFYFSMEKLCVLLFRTKVQRALQQ